MAPPPAPLPRHESRLLRPWRRSRARRQVGPCPRPSPGKAGQKLLPLLWPAPGLHMKYQFLARLRRCLPRRPPVPHIEAVCVRNNGPVGRELPVPTSRSTRMRLCRSQPHRAPSHLGVRVSLVPCIRPRRVPPQAARWPQVDLLPVARNMAGHNSSQRCAAALRTRWLLPGPWSRKKFRSRERLRSAKGSRSKSSQRSSKRAPRM